MPARATLQLSKMSKINSTQPLSSSPFEAERLNGAWIQISLITPLFFAVQNSRSSRHRLCRRFGDGRSAHGQQHRARWGGDPFAAVEEGFRIAAALEGVLLRSLNDCLESAEKHLSRLEKLSPQRTEDWLQTADKIKALGEEAQRLTINGNWADWDTALTLDVIDALTQSVDERILKIDAALEAAAESDVLTALESADTALKRAYGLLLERISAVLLLEALAASNVLYSTDYCRGMHSASRIAWRAETFPSTQKITNAVHALLLQTAETSGRTMTPQELDLLGAVKQDAKMLEALESASSTELQNGVKALQRVMDRRLLAEHPIARLMICMDGDGAAHFARPL